MLHLPDHWVWDSWYIHDGNHHHAFFLRASRALIDPHRRHYRASIGHAQSKDLRSWTMLPDALVHADSPAWDDLATWTGSVVRGPDERWHLFYTAVSRAEQGRIQRIGRAVSDDLVTWQRADPQHLVQADSRWYETAGDGDTPDQSWRDPWVFADPDGDGWHMLITARASEGDHHERGVLGHARSSDLVHWAVEPPLTQPAGFRWLEVPQVAVVDEHPMLLFSCAPADLSPRRRATRPSGSIWAAPAAGLLGPFDIEHAQPFPHHSLYAGRLVREDRTWSLIGFRDVENDRFHGDITDPIPVRYDHASGLRPVTNAHGAASTAGSNHHQGDL